MATTPREKYERRLKTFDKQVEAGEIDNDTAKAIRELLDAYNEDRVRTPKPPDESYRAPGTLNSWLYRLMAFGYERDLTSVEADDLNRDVEDMLDGAHSAVQDSGIKKTTLRSYQAALRRFYRYHDFGVEPGEIPMYSQKENGLDPTDTLTREEIDTARKAIGNPRDRLIFELLLNTGQRREALRTLRVKDVSPNEGETGKYRLNAKMEGLKNFRNPRGQRPLLGANDAVRDWINKYHPDPKPENFLITSRPSYSIVDPTEPVSGETIRNVMQQIKENSGIEKPMHPHMMRHNFVTMARVRFDMDPDNIKYLLGHAKDSTIMETTYSHLSGGEHLKRAEEAFGIDHGEDENELTPEVCPTCGAPLEADDKSCSKCGATFAPDAESNQYITQDEADELLTGFANTMFEQVLEGMEPAMKAAGKKAAESGDPTPVENLPELARDAVDLDEMEWDLDWEELSIETS